MTISASSNAKFNALIGAAVCASSFGVDPSEMYRLIDLGDLSASSEQECIPYSISENRRIVGSAGNDNNNPRAFLWMASDAFGFDAFELHDLGTNRPGNVGASRAYEINEQGFVVAESDQEILGPADIKCRGMIWNPNALGPADDPARKTFVGVLNDPSVSSNSAAFGLNDGVMFCTVGKADDDFYPGCTNDSKGIHDGPLLYQFPTPGVPARLNTSNPVDAAAFSVNASDLVVGAAAACSDVGSLTDFGASGKGFCVLNGPDPVAWQAPFGTAIELQHFMPSQSMPWFGIAKDVNVSGNIVGTLTQFDCSTPMFCVSDPADQRASYWESTADRFTDLTPFTGANFAAAAAITDLDSEGVLRVAGEVRQDLSGDASRNAFVWRRENGTWSGTNLNDLLPQAPATTNWTRLRFANDVTRDDWVIGTAIREPAAGASAGFLMVPVTTCPSDCSPRLVGNGVINIDDLFAVVAELGTFDGYCDVSPIPDDTDGDGWPDGIIGNGEVTLDDVMQVVNDFGNCPPVPGGSIGD